MRKILSLIGFLIEVVCLAFSVRIILPITNILPFETGDVLGSIFLLPYALFTLVVGFITSLIMLTKAKRTKNILLVILQKLIIFLYLAITAIFIIFTLILK